MDTSSDGIGCFEGEELQESVDELRESLGLSEEAFADEDALASALRDAAAFRANPLDVNSAPLTSLLRVPGLDPAAAARIVVSRTRYGDAPSLESLLDRRALSAAELESVRPYLVAAGHDTLPRESRAGSVPGAQSAPGAHGGVGVFGDGVSPAEHGVLKAPEVPIDTREIAWSLRVRASAREQWEESWGERDVWGIAGSFARLRASYGERLKLSLTCEKDAGERSMTDHAIGSLTWTGTFGAGGSERDENGPSVTVGLGEFSGSWGQGLMLGGGTFASSGAYPRRRDRLRAYDGAGESTSRRGAYVLAARGLLTVSGVLAVTRLDAATDESGLVTSIRTTGHHRTEGEVAGRGALRESMGGTRVAAGSGGWRVSGSALTFEFEPGLAHDDPVRKRFAFEGDGLRLIGLDARLEVGDVFAACEVVSASNGGSAGTASVAAQRASWRFRCGAGFLSRDYWSPVGGSVPGISNGSNGVSAWMRTEYRSRSEWKVWSAARVTGRPWRTYTSELPDRAASFSAGGDVRGGRAWTAGAECGVISRVSSGGQPSSTIESLTRRDALSLRLTGASPLTLTLKRVVRFEGRVESGATTSVSLRTDGAIGDRCSYTVGVTSASARGVAPSLFSYEPRLPGEFGLSSLNATGTRWYARVRIALPAGPGISIRAAGGPGAGRAEFGIGLDARG